MMSEIELSSVEELRIPTRIPRPVNDWILCKNMRQGGKQLASGIFLPEYETREDLALVIRTGDGVLNPSNGSRVGSPYRPGDVIRTTRKKGRSIYLQVDSDDDRHVEEHFNLYQEHETICVEYSCSTTEYNILRRIHDQLDSENVSAEYSRKISDRLVHLETDGYQE